MCSFSLIRQRRCLFLSFRDAKSNHHFHLRNILDREVPVAVRISRGGQMSLARTRRPPDLSKLHDVHENARKLAILYTIEVEVARLIGRWIPTIPNLDEKLLLGR